MKGDVFTAYKAFLEAYKLDLDDAKLDQVKEEGDDIDDIAMVEGARNIGFCFMGCLQRSAGDRPAVPWRSRPKEIKQIRRIAIEGKIRDFQVYDTGECLKFKGGSYFEAGSTLFAKRFRQSVVVRELAPSVVAAEEVVAFLGSRASSPDVLFAAEKQLAEIKETDELKVRLFAKGADKKILPLLEGTAAQNGHDPPSKLTKVFASSGLRSLLVAGREYDDEEEVSKFMSTINQANNKPDLVKWSEQNDAAAEFEKGMALFGCTAIEDKL
eukprot:SAG31_NODE_11487_length_1025_cov_0.764579_1_plen_268_part_10